MLSISFELLPKYFKTEEGRTTWVPYLLDEEQICVPVRKACKLLKRFPRYDQKIFMNVIVGDESWIHHFKPHQKISNRVWFTKNARRHCITTRITSTVQMRSKNRRMVTSEKHVNHKT